MVGSEYSPDNYKLLKISASAIIKNPKTLRFFPDHLRINKMCKNAVKTLQFVIR